jgi:hypothetical protein
MVGILTSEYFEFPLDEIEKTDVKGKKVILHTNYRKYTCHCNNKQEAYLIWDSIIVPHIRRQNVWSK